jgi:hypothetical protein
MYARDTCPTLIKRFIATKNKLPHGMLIALKSAVKLYVLFILSLALISFSWCSYAQQTHADESKGVIVISGNSTKELRAHLPSENENVFRVPSITSLLQYWMPFLKASS